MTVLVAGRPRPPAAWRGLLARSARLGLGRLARRRGELCVVLVSDKEMRRLNKRFLGHDRVTDVIAFGYDDADYPKTNAPGVRGRSAAPDDSPSGDIYICWDVARRQARELGHGLLEELLTLAAHGASHLAGYDDHAPAARRRMFARQDRLVRGLLRGR